MEERSLNHHPTSNVGNGQERTPSFYRFIMPSVLREHRLVLPKKFIDEYGDELSSKIKLVVPNGVTWYIRLKKANNLLFLHDGLEKFMNHYSIRFGYALVFNYKENSVFDVGIFDLTATEIEYRADCIFEKSGHNKNLEEKNHVDAETKGEKNVVDEVTMSKSDNPSFKVTLTDCCLKSFLGIPRGFSREHMRDCPEFIKIVDSNNRKFEILCSKYSDRMRLTRGWLNFVKETGLQTGDVCVIELIEKNFTFKVHVFNTERTKS